jgi:hypothetical protein
MQTIIISISKDCETNIPQTLILREDKNNGDSKVKIS